MNVKDFEKYIYELDLINTKRQEFALVVCLDDFLTEFSDESERGSEVKKDLINNAKKFINRRYPYLHITLLKVMAGGIIVASFSLIERNQTTAEERKISIPTEIHKPIPLDINKQEERKMSIPTVVHKPIPLDKFNENDKKEDRRLD